MGECLKNRNQIWLDNYSNVASNLNKINKIDTVLSVFNSNIDAIKKVGSKEFLHWLSLVDSGSSSDVITQGEIYSVNDIFEGFLYCFENGIAQEWLVKNKKIFEWLEKNVGYDHLQMGGQGGIIGNVMSVSGVKNVLVHGASLPKLQTSLFVDNDNLLSANNNGSFVKASSINREEDTPLIHWILEFNGGEEIVYNNRVYRSPKSNRFIVTYDPLNFRLSIDENFNRAVSCYSGDIEYCLLAGYQMLTENLVDNESSLDRIENSISIISNWKKQFANMKIHFEFASTQDRVVRLQLLQKMDKFVDSLGLNEQELIDILEIIGFEDIAQECRDSLTATTLFKGLEILFSKISVARIQLHMFGLYITIQNSHSFKSPKANRDGMMVAATVAASKAGTGDINIKENLLWAQDKMVGDISIKELSNLSNYLNSNYGIENFEITGIADYNNLSVIAVPTIIVDNPITLVGMGDTISSLSLVAGGV